MSHQPTHGPDGPSSSGEGAIPSSFFDEPIDFGSHVSLDQDPLQGLLNSRDVSTIGAAPVPESKPSGHSKAVSTGPTASAAPAAMSSAARDKTNEQKPKKPRKKKDASQAPVDSPAAAKSKKASKSTKEKAGPIGTNAGENPGKARSSTGRSMSRLSSVGQDVGTPPLQAANSRTTDVEEEPPAPRTAGEDEQNDDDDDEVDDGVEELGKDHYSTQEAIYAAQQQSMGLLSMIMDDDQLDRHMASRRGALNKTSVRKLVNHVLSQSVSQHVAMVVSGVAKIFVGEMVEKARAIQAARRETGPLRPAHLREAHRQYYIERERPGHYAPGTNTGFPGLGKRRRLF